MMLMYRLSSPSKDISQRMLLAKELTEIITALKYLVKLCFESPQRITLYKLYLIHLTIKYEPLMCYAEAIIDNLRYFFY